MEMSMSKKSPFTRRASLISVSEVARRAGVHRRTIYRWCEKGLLTPIRIVAPGNKRGVVRFLVDEVEFVLNGGRRPYK